MTSRAFETSSEAPPSTERRDSGTQVRFATEDSMLEELYARRDAHTFWDNRLLKAFRAGALNAADLRYVFSQYYLYARNFTRFVAALMTTCENDFYRARLSENLWAEGGGYEPELRHAHIFRRFLARGLGVTSLEGIDYDDATRLFVSEYLQQCRFGTPLAVSAFLSLGTEGIVPRLHAIFAEGLRKAGVDESDIALFTVHEGDKDESAVVLEQMMLSYAATPGWLETCFASMELALTLRERFFDSLFEGLRIRRLRHTLESIQGRASITPSDIRALHHRGGGDAKLLYASLSPRFNVDFVVERIPVEAEVLDPRLVRIPAGRSNERHSHAHELFLYVLRGRGRVLVEDAALDVGPGDGVLVPRWSMHQTKNSGLEELVYLAVTDFHLTDKVYVGDARPERATAPSLR
jgi:mannose-6-phosphate isomerase-like protein (cupin superfamily)/pyrroloquinoline quinone (PQQ) biosynthesis protein C